MKALQIVDWARYQHADSKRYASGMPWVKCPTTQSGLGYLDIMDHADGMAHFAAWVLILQVAAKCPPGGILVTDAGRALGARELALKTRGNVDIFKVAIDRLIAVGWLQWVEIQDDSKRTASGQQADSKRTSRQEEIREDKTRQDNNTTTTGGVVDVDPEADQDDIAAVVAPVTPRPPPPRPPMAFLDWVANGHPRVHLGGESRDLWEAYWRRYGVADNRAEIFDHAYRELAATLDNPRHKVWPTNADEWLRKNYPIPDGAA